MSPLLAVFVVLGQQDLSLKDAVREALTNHPSIASAAARVKAATARIDEAKSGKLPRVQYSESFARSDNPVFVFGALLTQRQFTENNFAIGSLNRPNFLNNFQSLVTAEQSIYDAGRTRNQVQSARFQEAMTRQEQRSAELEVIAGVARAYWSVVLAEEGAKAADASLKSAEADLKRAESIHDAGLSTPAEVLSLKVHVAAVHEQKIRMAQDREIAQAALNQAMGRPLETPVSLSTRLKDLAGASDTAPKTVGVRPEAELSRISVDLAKNGISAARSEWLPQVGVRTVFEADRQRFVTRAGANWLVAGSLQWNLFDGFQTRAKVNAATHQLAAAEATRKQVDSTLALAVKQAQIGVNSALERLRVAQAAVDMAQESLRIIQNRYDAGLTTVTELLRNESALLDARTRTIRAIYDLRLARVQLEFASGSLQGDSNVLN